MGRRPSCSRGAVQPSSSSNLPTRTTIPSAAFWMPRWPSAAPIWTSCSRQGRSRLPGSASSGRDAERMARASPDQVEAVWQAAAVVRRLFSTPTPGRRRPPDVRRTQAPAWPAARDAAVIVRDAEQLVAASPYRVRQRTSPPGAIPIGKADGWRCPPCPPPWRWWHGSRPAATRRAGPLSVAGGLAGPISLGRRPS